MAVVNQPISLNPTTVGNKNSITILFIVFSYNRPDMLRNVIEHVSAHGDVVVIDDKSDFNMHEVCLDDTTVYVAPEHRGKPGYWQQWVKAMEYAKEHTGTHVCFMPDDFLDIDIERLKNTIAALNNTHKYCINLINDGREQCFNHYEPRPKKINMEPFKQIGFVDCGFICNHAALKFINYTIKNPGVNYQTNPQMSSGVGNQLSRNFIGDVNMYLPERSFAYHGNHASMMHPELRKTQPLQSKH